MDPDLSQVTRESLASAIRRKANEYTLISDAAILMNTLYASGRIEIRRLAVGVLLLFVVFDVLIRRRSLGKLASARGAEELDRMRRRMPTYWLALTVIYLGAFVALVDVGKGQATVLTYGVIVALVAAGVFVHLRVKPTLDRAWESLLELDSRTSASDVSEPS